MRTSENTGSRGRSSAAAVLISLLAIVGSAHATPLFDPASFGTGIGLGTFPATERFRPPNPAAQQAFGLTTPFQPSATGARLLPDTLGGEHAFARAEFGKTGFELGAAAFIAHPDRGVFTAQAMAVAYTGILRASQPVSSLSGQFAVDGFFETTGPFADRQDVRMLFDIWDIFGNFLGEITADHGFIVQVITARGDVLQDLDVWPGSADSPGSLILPFTLPLNFDPLLASDNGVLARLWVFASADPEHLSIADFSTTATLTFFPPPGITVTLATGQVFGASPQQVPEPATVWLLIVGLAAVRISLIRRRQTG